MLDSPVYSLQVYWVGSVSSAAVSLQSVFRPSPTNLHHDFALHNPTHCHCGLFVGPWGASDLPVALSASTRQQRFSVKRLLGWMLMGLRTFEFIVAVTGGALPPPPSSSKASWEIKPSVEARFDRGASTQLLVPGEHPPAMTCTNKSHEETRSQHVVVL